MKARDRADSMLSSSKKMVCIYMYNDVLCVHIVCTCCIFILVCIHKKMVIIDILYTYALHIYAVYICSTYVSYFIFLFLC
jgi:hypothetical protein